jgi:Na+-transporting methylmalonyl-CoA/oxaloacetate decarboxylase beta subunit
MKKVISIIAIVAGGLVLLSVAAPVLIGAILEFQMKAQVAGSVGIIGGADGPTAVMITGVTRVGSAVTEIVVGALLIVAGIWGLRKSKK